MKYECQTLTVIVNVNFEVSINRASTDACYFVGLLENNCVNRCIIRDNKSDTERRCCWKTSLMSC